MKLRRIYLICGCSSLVFIFLTYIVARRMDLGALSELAFMLHLVPFGLGFGGSPAWQIYLYYIGLWVAILFVFKAIHYLLFKLK